MNTLISYLKGRWQEPPLIGSGSGGDLPWSAGTSVFIEVRSDHRKRFAMKTLSLLVSIVFMVQQLAYSLGINYG
ncbi:MAG: hypothetical protein PHQ61_08570, partial [Candidatus Omnitrophica bacterium]|nr:hypothetical protein [Candidatus Omnitrophota bacterium]